MYGTRVRTLVAQPLSPRGRRARWLAVRLSLLFPITSLLDLIPVTRPFPTGEHKPVRDKLDRRLGAFPAPAGSEDVDILLAREEELQEAQALVLAGDVETQEHQIFL